MVLVVRYLVLLEVVSSVESSSGPKGKRGTVSLKGIFEYAQKRKEGKDLFERESCREKSLLWACQFLGSRPTVNMCSDTIL